MLPSLCLCVSVVRLVALGRMAPCLWSVLLISLLAGCGNQLVSVEGQVTLDGKPVAAATITFMPDAADLQPATAYSDADGRFHLETRGVPGGMIGSYTVVVSKYEFVED